MRTRTVVVAAPAVLVALALAGCLSTNPQTPASRSTASDQTTDFYNLLQTGTPEQVQKEVDAGADVNAQENTLGFTPLMWAAGLNPNPEVITVLLKAGAHINARAAGGMTPLMSAAARNKNPEVIAALLDAGADTKAKDSQGRTAFDYAQQNASLKDTDAYGKLEEASK